MPTKSKVPEFLDRALVVNASYYCLCITPKEYKVALDYLKIKKSERPSYVNNWHSNATLHTFTNIKNQSITSIICLKGYEDKTKIEIYSLLVHEATHLWQQSMRDYGEQEPSDEFESYSIQSLSQNLMESFDKKTRRGYGKRKN